MASKNPFHQQIKQLLRTAYRNLSVLEEVSCDGELAISNDVLSMKGQERKENDRCVAWQPPQGMILYEGAIESARRRYFILCSFSRNSRRQKKCDVRVLLLQSVDGMTFLLSILDLPSPGQREKILERLLYVATW